MTNPPQPESAFTSATFLALWVLPFASYYLGITIRKFAFSSTSQNLVQLYLIGIPAGLVVVPPMLALCQSALSATNGQNHTAYLIALGVVMEHGLVVPEYIHGKMTDLGRSKNMASLAANHDPSEGTDKEDAT
jgi:cytochrome c biogenesis protein CcdA